MVCALLGGDVIFCYLCVCVCVCVCFCLFSVSSLNLNTYVDADEFNDIQNAR